MRQMVSLILLIEIQTDRQCCMTEHFGDSVPNEDALHAAPLLGEQIHCRGWTSECTSWGWG